jgi:hypothetical protein
MPRFAIIKMLRFMHQMVAKMLGSTVTKDVETRGRQDATTSPEYSNFANAVDLLSSPILRDHDRQACAAGF